MVDYIKDDYDDLPDNLREFNYYCEDYGHVVMAIPQCFEYEARLSGDPWTYEIAVPCKYILRSGYTIVHFKKDFYIVCDVDFQNGKPIFEEEYIEKN